MHQRLSLWPRKPCLPPLNPSGSLLNPFIQHLVEIGPIVTDGAWGTQFQARGLASGELPDAWNLSNPEAVAEIARVYIQAGSQIILTNTFSSNRLRLVEQGLDKEVVAINRNGVEISLREATGHGYVFASIGPSGKMLMSGDTTEEELQAVFDEQARALADAGADALVIETMSDLAEAKLAVTAARDTALPVVACMVYDSGKDKDRTMMGTTPEQAAQALAEAGADVIGANCGQGIEGFVSICRRLRTATDLPIWIKANAGLPELVDGKPIYRATPESFAGHLPALVEAGATFIGGCCGTTPDFIQAVKKQLLALSGHKTVPAGLENKPGNRPDWLYST